MGPKGLQAAPALGRDPCTRPQWGRISEPPHSSAEVTWRQEEEERRVWAVVGQHCRPLGLPWPLRPAPDLPAWSDLGSALGGG